MPIHITFYAHSTTADNEAGKSSGWSDSPLSEIGIKQSRELAIYLQDKNFDVVFSSDLTRAVDTTKLAFSPKIKMVVDPRLRDCNYGMYNGQLSSIVEPKCEYEHIATPFPGGESMNDVKNRIENFLIFLEKSYFDKQVAIVAHKAPQIALEILLKGKTWPQAFKEDWRKTKSWQPGWDYLLG